MELAYGLAYSWLMVGLYVVCYLHRFLIAGGAGGLVPFVVKCKSASKYSRPAQPKHGPPGGAAGCGIDWMGADGIVPDGIKAVVHKISESPECALACTAHQPVMVTNGFAFSITIS